MKTSPLILATQSPRRIALLTALHVPFRLLHVRFRETMPSLPPEEAARLLAWRKAETARRRLTRGLVVTADTMVALDQTLFGKPRSAEDARQMLRQLSGRTHQVITAIAIQDAATRCGIVGSAISHVTFRRLSPRTIAAYVAGGEPLDKAGGYAIQGGGLALVRSVRGDYFNVVGLPLKLLALLGSRFGLRLPAARVAALYRRPAAALGG